MSLLSRNVGRVLVAALVVECVVLGTVQVRRWLGSGAPRGAAGMPAPGAPPPGTERVAASTPPPASRTSPNAGPGTARDLRTSTTGAGASSGAGEVRAATQGGDDAGAAAPRVADAQGASGAGSSAAGAGVSSAPAGSPRPRVAGGPGLAPAGPVPGTAPTPPDAAGAPDGVVMRTTAMPAPVTPAPAAAPADGHDGRTAAAPKHADQPHDPDAPADGSGEDDAAADATPPVLESLRFDPPQVEGGGITMLTIQASDARSGIKSLWGEIRSPNRSAALSFGSASPGSGPMYQFPIALPASAQTGTWYVAWISLTDGADNTRLVQAASAAAAPPGGTFAAFSTQSDATPPEVLQVRFDRSAVSPGEKNLIAVEARDDLSGVASVTGACQSPSKSALVWFNAVLNAEAGAWLADIPIPANADCGEWVVQQLAVKDQAGNTTLLHPDAPVLARAGFGVVSGSGCDFTAPTLDAFDLTPAIVSSGSGAEILVTAKVDDEGSGAVSMTGWFEGPASAGGQVPKNYFSCAPDPRDPAAPWTGRIQVPPLAARGTWKVGMIRLEDKARNARTYSSVDPVVSGRVFQVQ